MSLHFFALALLTCCLTAFSSNAGADSALPADARLAEYFRTETAKISERCLKDIHTLDDWNSQKIKYREQLQDMLGLFPMPEKTDLKPVITGKIEAKDFVV